MKTIKTIFTYFLIILIVKILPIFANENKEAFEEENHYYKIPILFIFPKKVDSIIFEVRNFDCKIGSKSDSVYLKLDHKFYKRFLKGIKLINAKAYMGRGCKVDNYHAYMDFYIPFSIKGDKIRITFIHDFIGIINIGGKECNIYFNKKFSNYIKKLYWKARKKQNKKYKSWGTPQQTIGAEWWGLLRGRTLQLNSALTIP